MGVCVVTLLVYLHVLYMLCVLLPRVPPRPPPGPMSIQRTHYGALILMHLESLAVTSENCCFHGSSGVRGTNTNIDPIRRIGITREMLMIKKNVNQKKTAVSGLEFGVMNVRSLGSRVDYVIDHAKENKLDVVVLTETWLSNVETNNATVVNYCMERGYTLHHRPRSDGRRGGGVGVLVSNGIKLTTRQVSVDPKVASFEHMELVITVSSITIRLITIYRMPRSKGAVNTDGEQLSFCDEFSNYIEKLSCASGVILLAGDFNVDWLDGNGLERRQLYNIFETFGLTQNINVATSKHHHLLDYIITRKYCEYISNFAVSHFISDHRALHASVRCIRPHPVRKRLRVRALRRIDGERLDSDLASFTVDNECVDVNTVVARYDGFLSSLLNKHAPLKEIDVVERPLNDWMTDNILALKKKFVGKGRKFGDNLL